MTLELDMARTTGDVQTFIAKGHSSCCGARLVFQSKPDVCFWCALCNRKTRARLDINLRHGEDFTECVLEVWPNEKLTP